MRKGCLRRLVRALSLHKNEIKKVYVASQSATSDADVLKQVKDENVRNASELDTILHPNKYIKRSFSLKNLCLTGNGDLGVDGPSQGSN